MYVVKGIQGVHLRHVGNAYLWDACHAQAWKDACLKASWRLQLPYKSLATDFDVKALAEHWYKAHLSMSLIRLKDMSASSPPQPTLATRYPADRYTLASIC